MSIIDSNISLENLDDICEPISAKYRNKEKSDKGGDESSKQEEKFGVDKRSSVQIDYTCNRDIVKNQKKRMTLLDYPIFSNKNASQAKDKDQKSEKKDMPSCKDNNKKLENVVVGDSSMKNTAIGILASKLAESHKKESPNSSKYNKVDASNGVFPDKIAHKGRGSNSHHIGPPVFHNKRENKEPALINN